jgi:gas vesicle protein
MKSEEFGYLWMGIAIGAGITALLTPRSGAQTREYLRGMAADGGERAKAGAEELRRKAKEAMDRGSATVRHQTENLTAALDAGKEAYREAVRTTP